MPRAMLRVLTFLSCSIVLLAGPSSADEIQVELTGYEEVPPVSTNGFGRFRINERSQYELEYEDLEDEIVQAHVHFGPEGDNGGIIVWLCDNPDLRPQPPFDVPECRGRRGRVRARLARGDIVGPQDQGIEPGDARAAQRAFVQGLTYVNVHTVAFEGGEIRGQLNTDGDGLQGRLSYLEEEVDELRDDFEHHGHTYLTGRGAGHNNTEATTGPPEF
jgi:hypothetical protein